MDLAITNNLRILFISYKYSVDDLVTYMEDQLARLLGDIKVVEKILNKHFMFEAINPYAFSLEESLLYENELVVKQDIDIILFHGVEMLVPEMMTNPFGYYNSVVN